MQNSRRTQSIWKYLALLAVLVAVPTGMLVAKDLYPASLDSQGKALTLFPAAPDNPPLPAISGTASRCFSPLIYTSYPPKCRTSDGKFLQIEGIPSNFLVLPQGK